MYCGPQRGTDSDFASVVVVAGRVVSDIFMSSGCATRRRDK